MLSGKHGAAMAKVPTAEDAARYILKIFILLNARSGDVLRINSFIMPFAKAPWQASDFEPGMEYAIEQGWVVSDSPDSYHLTEDGFAEA
jgi:hypothetical protein